MTTATDASPARTHDVFGPLDPATYRRSLHLLVDLPAGLITFTVATTLVALSSGLAITLAGIPLLVGTLVAALLRRAERLRARLLLGLNVPAPAMLHGWTAWLAAAASWRTLGYALLLDPVGLLIGTLTLVAWSTVVTAIFFPANSALARPRRTSGAE
jgi:hypothetical protein